MLNIQSVHDTVVAVFDELGADSVGPIAESVLVRGGYLVGRRFQRGGVRIIWFLDEAELKVYGSDGKLQMVVDLSASRLQAA